MVVPHLYSCRLRWVAECTLHWTGVALIGMVVALVDRVVGWAMSISTKQPDVVTKCML